MYLVTQPLHCLYAKGDKIAKGSPPGIYCCCVLDRVELAACLWLLHVQSTLYTVHVQGTPLIPVLSKLGPGQLGPGAQLSPGARLSGVLLSGAQFAKDLWYNQVGSWQIGPWTVRGPRLSGAQLA